MNINSWIKIIFIDWTSKIEYGYSMFCAFYFTFLKLEKTESNMRGLLTVKDGSNTSWLSVDACDCKKSFSGVLIEGMLLKSEKGLVPKSQNNKAIYKPSCFTITFYYYLLQLLFKLLFIKIGFWLKK